MNNPQDYPSLEQFAAHIAAVQGKIEIIRQPLYDRLIYPTAGLASFTFFALPIGNGFSSEPFAAAAAKTLADTNMTQNGQLPAPQAFWLEDIQAYVEAGGVATANLFSNVAPVQALAVAAVAAGNAGILDKQAILNFGFLVLNIGQKPYFNDSPMYTFPPKQRFRIDAAIGNADTTTHNEVFAGAAYADGEPRRLVPGLGLATGFNFNVTVNYPVLVATPSGFNARMKISLGGWLFRAAQ